LRQDERRGRISSKHVDDGVCEACFGTEPKRDETAVGRNNLAEYRNVGADDTAAREQGFNNRKAEALGLGRSYKRLCVPIAPLKACVGDAMDEEHTVCDLKL
jgi:hypothetical protein